MNRSKIHKNDNAARAAWMYYIYKMNQDEIAKTMGISRQRAQRLISLAVNENLVNFKINHSIVSCQELSLELKKKFNLMNVDVAPNVSNKIDKLDGIVNLASKTIDTFLMAKKPMNLIFGSGLILSKVADKLSPVTCLQHKIVSNIGNHGPDGLEPPYFVLGRISQNVESNFFPFTVPIYSSSKEVQKFFLNYFPVKKTINLIKNFDACFVTIGGFASKKTAGLLRDSLIDDDKYHLMKSKGVIGQINGVCFDENGKIVKNIDSYIPMSILPDANSNKPVIAFAGGSDRVHAIKAALNGRLVNGLITDEVTAEKLL